MSEKDKIKWNNKYNQTPKLLEQRPQSEKLNSVLKYTNGKKALDVACGSGRNSIFLAKEGFEVTAIDISEVALKALNEQNHKNINTKQVDLEEFSFEENSYDLIIMTNFLDRKIIPKLKTALKQNGVLFIETYMFHDENEKPPSNPNFLLKQGELKTFFDDMFEVLEYDEFFNENYELYKMRKQVILVKRRQC